MAEPRIVCYTFVYHWVDSTFIIIPTRQDPLRTRAILQRYCGGNLIRRGAISSVCTFTFTTVPCVLMIAGANGAASAVGQLPASALSYRPRSGTHCTTSIHWTSAWETHRAKGCHCPQCKWQLLSGHDSS